MPSLTLLATYMALEKEMILVDHYLNTELTIS